MSGNKVVPTSTVLQTRVMLYQPSQRPRFIEGEWFDTAFGQCRVTGRLGQRHADVMESILWCAEKIRSVDDGGIELLVDPAKVRRTLSDKQYSHQRIRVFIKELRAAVVEIITPDMGEDDDPIIGGLLDSVKPSPMTRPDPLTGKDRKLWRVRLGDAMVMLLGNDIKLYYEPAPIARLQHGVSQAVARHVLSHKHSPVGGWHLDTLLRAVFGENAPSQTIRNGRRRLKEDAELLLSIGIEINDDYRVKRFTTAR